MLLPFASAGRGSSRGVASKLAMAFALASGVVVSSAVIAPDAHAQRRERAQQGGNSPEFAAAYSPVAALVTGEMPNWAAARGQFDTLAAAIKNEDDRNIAGNFALQIGTNLSDVSMQRRGLEMMLQSGKVAPERVGQFNFFVGNIAYQMEDYAAARAALQAAMAAGYTEGDPRGLIIQSYFEGDDTADGLDHLASLVAAGVPQDQNWYLSALQAAYDAGSLPLSVRASTALVQQFPTTENWTKALQVVNDLGEYEPEEQIDMFRLMRVRDAINQRAVFLRYVYVADSRRVPDEVLGVLAEGLAAGEFTATGDADYTTELATARSRSALDRQNMASLLRDGERGDQLDALNTGDVLYSQGEFARAETFYRLSLQKGGDRDLTNLRIGMMQALQGNSAGAAETLALVSGRRQPIAAMWALSASIPAS